MMSEMVLVEREGPVAVLTLNRPERHNSLVPELVSALLNAFRTLGGQPDIHALVLQANGRSFSTGSDVKGFYGHLSDIPAYSVEIVGRLNEVMLEMVATCVPIIAAVHGQVTGASMGLVLASDLVLVSPEACFTPYQNVVGFGPDGGWTALLPSIIGRQRAAHVLMLNQTITAEQAVAWGIANRMVPAAEIQQEARDVARTIALRKPGSIRRTKRLLWGAAGPVSERLEAERHEFTQQIMTAEAQQGLAEFLEGVRKRRGPGRDAGAS